MANDYVKNRACFDPNNELVLNDGILFDPRISASGRVVHKFDKLNNDISGVFHPKGNEVIINSEVVCLLFKLYLSTRFTKELIIIKNLLQVVSLPMDI